VLRGKEGKENEKQTGPPSVVSGKRRGNKMVRPYQTQGQMNSHHGKNETQSHQHLQRMSKEGRRSKPRCHRQVSSRDNGVKRKEKGGIEKVGRPEISDRRPQKTLKRRLMTDNRRKW